jgi:hypothetical protein
MRVITAGLLALALALSMEVSGASAAQGDTYKAKKATCQDRASGMKFGIHLIRKNRWVKDCIAGKHPA